MVDEMREFARAYAYGECAPREVQELEKVLKDNAEAREVFLSEMNIHACLEHIAIDSLDQSKPLIGVGESEVVETNVLSWLSPLAIPVIIVTSILLLALSVVWQNQPPVSDQNIAGEPGPQVVEDETKTFGNYPSWVFEKDIMSPAELSEFEESLVVNGFERSSIPKLMAGIVRSAYGVDGENQKVTAKELFATFKKSFGLTDRQVELLDAISLRLQNSQRFKRSLLNSLNDSQVDSH